jgi:hypothetical protein
VNLLQFSPMAGPANGPQIASFQKDPSMKLILTMLGVLLLSMAGIYFLMPADQLPAFFPGHNDDVTRLHTKHGIVAGVAGLALIAASIWVGRK